MIRKAAEEPRAAKLGRLPQGDHSCDRAAPLHSLVGPHRGRVAAWRARRPKGSRCTCDANEEKEGKGVTSGTNMTCRVGVGKLWQPYCGMKQTSPHI